MTSQERRIQVSPFAVFRNRSFSLLWVGQVVETIGASLTSLAASILVYRLTGSAASVGLMLMASAAPTILVGLLAGVVVDRYDRKRIMVVADLIRAVLVLLIPFLIQSSMAWLYIIVALSAAVTQFFDPAHEAVLPEIATDDELAAANSLMAISSFGATAIGFAASGLIASSMSIEWAFYLNAAAYAFSALMIGLARVPALTAGGESGLAAIGRNLKEGAVALWSTPILRSLFVVFSVVFVAFGLSNTLLLPFALTALKASEFEYGVQEAVTSVGFVLGSLWMGRVSDRLREGQWIAIGLIGMGLVSMIYASMRSVGLAIGVIAVSGFLNAPMSIARSLAVQRNTPRELRGRVNSAFFVCRDVLFLLGMAAAGLADILPVRLLYFFSAVLTAGAGAWALVVPGLGQPAAEWRRALELLRRAPTETASRAMRPATLADVDLLIGKLSALGTLNQEQRQALVADASILDVPAGAALVKLGDKSDEVYFVLEGQAVAGVVSASSEGGYRSLSTHNPGDFFGEIAALSGEPRTANVVAAKASRFLAVPARVVRTWLEIPLLRRLFLAAATDRLSRTHTADWPRLAGLDQQALRELRDKGVAER